MEREQDSVLVGMSGGVDSSAAALLLQRQGYSVAGCTLRLRGQRLSGSWQEEQDIEDARRVCEALGMEHFVWDLTEVFCQAVAEEFIREYRCGRTPNPCVTCNRTIKFGAMLNLAREKGFSHIATGHYVRRKYDDGAGRWQLYRADSGKDQSYVLYGLSQEQVAHALFPLDGMEKEEVRALAREYRLPVAEKGDSMEVCFIPDHDHSAFIDTYTGTAEQPGDFLSADGTRLGQHQGISRYTIGQRKGLGIALGCPHYVAAIDAVTRTVILSPEAPLSDRFTVEGVNYLSMAPAAAPFRAEVKIRYQAPPAAAWIEPLGETRALIRPERPLRAVTPGQSAVFYDGACLLGGGIITSDS